METVYADLVYLHTTEKLDFSLCRTFNLDEYIRLAPTDPNSYRCYMNDHLFKRVNIDLRIPTCRTAWQRISRRICLRYEALIRECNGIDLQLLGIGKSGHIGFNEPLSALLSRTRPKALTPVTIREK